jgi:hypothetical protein
MGKRQRDLRLSKYGISKYRYRELYNMCMQYPEWKFFLESQTDTIKAAGMSGEPDGGAIREKGEHGFVYLETMARVPRAAQYENQGENLAIRRAEISDKCRVIEECANQAGGGIFKWLLYAVTHEAVTYYDLRERHNMPCGREMFDECRRKFFFNLSEKLEEKQVAR